MRDSTERAALMALLDDHNTTLAKAAAAAGLSRRTLYACVHDLGFLRKLQQARTVQAMQRAEELGEARQKAIAEVVALMGDETQPGPVRVSAARLVLTAEAEAQARLDSILRDCNLNAKWP